MKKVFLFFSLICISICILSACNHNSEPKKEKIVISYQYGTGYAPFMIMQNNKLIEKHYPNIEIEWQILNSGVTIIEGVTAGRIDIAAVGAAPCITGISKGAPYKIYSNISGQPQGLITNNPDIKSLSDITPNDKIAAVNVGSIQHILLSMLAQKELGNAHALDNNISPMSNPDGMQALLSQNVSCHITSSPYTIQELKHDNLYLISDTTEVYPHGSPFIVGIASTKTYENEKLYNALVKATDEALDYINNNPDETAAIICDKMGVTEDEALEYLTANGSVFKNDISGISQLTKFMGEANFIENVPTSRDDIVYDNVNYQE